MCGRLMSPAHETQSMREIRFLRGRLPRKGGGLTGMYNVSVCEVQNVTFKRNMNYTSLLIQYPKAVFLTRIRMSLIDCCS